MACENSRSVSSRIAQSNDTPPACPGANAGVLPQQAPETLEEFVGGSLVGEVPLDPTLACVSDTPVWYYWLCLNALD